jgi:hypothetical protein
MQFSGSSDAEAFEWLQQNVAGFGKFRIESVTDGYSLTIQFSNREFTGYNDVFAKTERTKVGTYNMEWSHPNVREVKVAYYDETVRAPTLLQALEGHFGSFIGDELNYKQEQALAANWRWEKDESLDSPTSAEQFIEDFELKKGPRHVKFYVAEDA